MQLNLSGHHVEVTPAMRAYAEKRLERILRHFGRVIDVHMVMSVEKNEHKAEATLHIRGNDIHAIASDTNMYRAIDALADKLDRQITKHKEKLSDHHRGEAGRASREKG